MKWAERIIQSCPDTLRKTLHQPLCSLHIALASLRGAYAAPIAPLVPRPALILFGHIASSLYLLEHTIWANVHDQTSLDCDIEVFRRWIEEGGLHTVIEDVRKAKDASANRAQLDLLLVYGHEGVVPNSGDGTSVRARL